jgi:hypothetical protein
MRRHKIIRHDFREGWYAFQNDVPVWSNPYGDCVGRAEVWESGWTEAEKSRQGGGKSRAGRRGIMKLMAKTSREGSDAPTASKTTWLVKGMVGAALLTIAFAVAVVVCIALFGDWFAADRVVLNHTDKAQESMSRALYRVLGEYGRVQVRQERVRLYFEGNLYGDPLSGSREGRQGCWRSVVQERAGRRPAVAEGGAS